MTEYARLPMDADSHDEVFHYYATRALQLALSGYKWSKVLTEVDGGFITEFTNQSGEVFNSLYVVASRRGNGTGTRLIKQCQHTIVTVADCKVEEFLQRSGVPHVVATHVYDSYEYKAVQRMYGDERAERSRVHKMRHIDEGLLIMNNFFGCSRDAMLAYCLHPMLQDDVPLAAHLEDVVDNSSSKVVALALEYRHIANAYLSKRSINSLEDIHLSPLREVNDMLIADKIQNRKDFAAYHLGTHPRSKELEQYFLNWLQRLNVSPTKYADVVSFLNDLVTPC